MVASIAISAFLITVTVTRYVSLISWLWPLLPLLAWFLKSPPPHVMFVAVLCVMTPLRHRPNIVRLIEGVRTSSASVSDREQTLWEGL